MSPLGWLHAEIVQLYYVNAAAKRQAKLKLKPSQTPSPLLHLDLPARNARVEHKTQLNGDGSKAEALVHHFGAVLMYSPFCAKNMSVGLHMFFCENVC